MVSLMVGKLCVGTHECSFDLVVGEALILPQLTALTLSKLHLRVEFKSSSSSVNEYNLSVIPVFERVAFWLAAL